MNIARIICLHTSMSNKHVDITMHRGEFKKMKIAVQPDSHSQVCIMNAETYVCIRTVKCVL